MWVNINTMYYPGTAPARKIPAAYLALRDSGELSRRAIEARQHLAACDLCARYCLVDRQYQTDGAVCQTGTHARVHACLPHRQVNDPIRGHRGSGEITFAGCGLRCDYCRDWEINKKGNCRELDDEELANEMLSLQEQGCDNISLISPSHVVAQIIAALAIAADRGLTIPVVYNSAGYDSIEALQLLDGIVDIYIPDMKYGANELGKHYSHVINYVEFNHLAVQEMHRQVGDLVLDNQGLAMRGLLVRHLMLPNNQAATKQVLSYISAELSPNTYIHLMDSYTPSHLAIRHEKLNRPVSEPEVRRALKISDRCGLTRLHPCLSRSWLAL